MWRHANKPLTLKYYQYRTVYKKNEFEKAKLKYFDTLKVSFFRRENFGGKGTHTFYFQSIKKYSDRIRPNDPLRPFVDIIVAQCPPEYNVKFQKSLRKFLRNMQGIKQGEGDFEPSYKNLVKLHKNLITSVHNLKRCQR